MLKALVGILKGQAELRKKMGHLNTELLLLKESMQQMQDRQKQEDHNRSSVAEKLGAFDKSLSSVHTRLTHLQCQEKFPGKIWKSLRKFFRI